MAENETAELVELARGVHTLGTRVQALRTDVGNLTRSEGKRDEQIDRIRSDLDEIKLALARREGQGHHERIGELERRTGELERRVADSERRLDPETARAERETQKESRAEILSMLAALGTRVRGLEDWSTGWKAKAAVLFAIISPIFAVVISKLWP